MSHPVIPPVQADATDARGSFAKELEALAQAQQIRSQANLWKGLFDGYQSDPTAPAATSLGQAQADSATQNAARAAKLRSPK